MFFGCVQKGVGKKGKKHGMAERIKGKNEEPVSKSQDGKSPGTYVEN